MASVCLVGKPIRAFDKGLNTEASSDEKDAAVRSSPDAENDAFYEVKTLSVRSPVAALACGGHGRLSSTVHDRIGAAERADNFKVGSPRCLPPGPRTPYSTVLSYHRPFGVLGSFQFQQGWRPLIYTLVQTDVFTLKSQECGLFLADWTPEPRGVSEDTWHTAPITAADTV